MPRGQVGDHVRQLMNLATSLQNDSRMHRGLAFTNKTFASVASSASAFARTRTCQVHYILGMTQCPPQSNKEPKWPPSRLAISRAISHPGPFNKTGAFGHDLRPSRAEPVVAQRRTHRPMAAAEPCDASKRAGEGTDTQSQPVHGGRPTHAQRGTQCKCAAGVRPTGRAS